ncbi:MAG: hypothetical protein U1E78_13115 [Gammaproteobacteria bacterium]
MLFSSVVIAGTNEAEQAQRMSELVAQKMGTSKALNENYVNPLMTGSSMTTLDGNKSFKGQMMCQSSEAFLRMNLQPLSSGDVKIISIEQDASLSGKIDAFTTPSWIISGVCANGFMQCKPGTWQDCKAYHWHVGEDNVLNAKETAFSDLGGCYCINNDCGTGLAWSNLNAVLTNLGGGAAAALAKRHPFYAIGDVKTTQTSITYYGQNGASCQSNSLKDTAALNQLVQYQNNHENLKKDAFEQQNINPLYSKLTKGPLNTDGGHAYHQCSIKREIPINETRIDDIIGYESGAGGVSTCGPDCLNLTIGNPNYRGGQCTIDEHHAKFYIKKPERILSATLTHAAWDDWIQIHANEKYIWSGPFNNWTDYWGRQPGACELNRSWSQSPNVDFTSLLKKKGPIDFRVRVEIAGLGYGYASAIVKVDTACHLEKDEIIDTCKAYQADPDCSLMEEKVDGVFTFRHSAGTGLSPIAQEKKIAGSMCEFKLKRDWFQKERKYLCKKQGKYSFNLPDTSQYSISVKEPVKVPMCVQSCKTRKARPQHDASISGVTGSNKVSPVTYDFFYHECKNDTICPIEDGEEIIKSCQCIDEFAESTAMMQTLRMAGQDILCSSGTSRPMDGF